MRLLVVAMLSSLALAQTSSSPAQGQKPSASPAQPSAQQPAPAAVRPTLQSPPPGARQAKPQEVAANAPVITIPGICDKPTPGTGSTLAECKTEVSKAEFEKLIDAVAAEPPPAGTRRQLAVSYARMLALEKVARDRNLLNQPRTQELIHLARLQAIAQALQRNFQEEAARITPQEIEQSYRAHPELWDELSLRRIYIPKAGSASAPALDDAAAKSLADKIRARAAAGEDTDKLQKEVWEASGVKSEAPSTKAGPVRRANFPPSQLSVFDLKIGEVSQPFHEAGGSYIYKLDARQTIPLEKARPEIEGRLRSEKFQREAESVLNSIQPKLNDTYFGEGGAPRPDAAPGATPPPPQKPPQPR